MIFQSIRKNIAFPAEAEYSYFSAYSRLRMILVNIVRL